MKENDKYQILLKYDRTNFTYKPEQFVTGIISIQHKSLSKFKVDVASLTMKPIGKIQPSNKHSNKRLQNIFNEIKPIEILKSDPIELAQNKTLDETSQITFRFKLSKGEHKYAESYVGVYFVITYEIEVEVKFKGLHGPIADKFMFNVQVPKQGRDLITDFVIPKKKNFMIKSQDMKGKKLDGVKIRGEFESEILLFTDALNGTIIIDQADEAIREITVPLYRVQKISGSSEVFAERTEIQMIQMCEGNVTRNLQLPIYMVFPKLYSCPSLKYLWCQLDFEIDLLIIFKNGSKLSVNIPLKLIRS